MSSSNKDRLLHETLRESREYEAFRDAMFRTGLAELRNKRVGDTRWLRWALAACVVFGIGLALAGRSSKNEPPQLASSSSIDSFVSQPFSARDVVRSMADELLVVQTKNAQSPVEVVTTERAPLIELNDRQLLAALGNKPAGFVRNNGHLEFVVLGN